MSFGSGQVKMEGGAKVQLVASGPGDTSLIEDYTLSLPDLVINNPLASSCPVEWKGMCPGAALC